MRCDLGASSACVTISPNHVYSQFKPLQVVADKWSYNNDSQVGHSAFEKWVELRVNRRLVLDNLRLITSTVRLIHVAV